MGAFPRPEAAPPASVENGERAQSPFFRRGAPSAAGRSRRTGARARRDAARLLVVVVVIPSRKALFVRCDQGQQAGAARGIGAQSEAQRAPPPRRPRSTNRRPRGCPHLYSPLRRVRTRCLGAGLWRQIQTVSVVAKVTQAR